MNTNAVHFATFPSQLHKAEELELTLPVVDKGGQYLGCSGGKVDGNISLHGTPPLYTIHEFYAEDARLQLHSRATD